LRRSFSTGGDRPWAPGDLKGFVGISGPYHVPATAAHWKARGFGQAMLDFVFGDEAGMDAASPTTVASSLAARFGTSRGGDLPPICLLHGTADMSAPPVAAELFEARLASLGRPAELCLYKGWTHTDPILERPFAGDQRLHRDLLDRVRTWCGAKLPAFDAEADGLGRLCPQVMIDFGHYCMPF